MPREFANQKALIDYAEQNGLAYAWQGSLAFAKRQRSLSPEQYEIVEVRTSHGMSRAMLFSQAILLAEWEADAPFREAMAIKRERWRAKRAQERLAAERAAKQRRCGPYSWVSGPLSGPSTFCTRMKQQEVDTAAPSRGAGQA
jgi:hypothetical protein